MTTKVQHKMPSLAIYATFIVCLLIINDGVFAYKMPIHHHKHPKLKHLFNNDNIEDAHGDRNKHPKLKHLFNEVAHGKSMVHIYNGIHVVHFEIGNQEVYLVFDTGSHFTWVQWDQCTTCLPIYPPITTKYKITPEFSYETCNATAAIDCKNRQGIPRSKCALTKCLYLIKYADHSTSLGIVGSDRVTLFTDKSIVQTMVFGIGWDNHCHPENSCFQGVAGFGVGPLAVQTQLTPKPDRWSFCLPINETLDGSFMVGDDAQIVGGYGSAPLFLDDYHYLVNLTYIYVDGSVSEKVQVPQETSTVLIDSGSRLSYLESNLFDNVRNMVKESVAYNYNVDPIYSDDYSRFELCYGEIYKVDIIVSIWSVDFVLSNPEKVWWSVNSSYHCLSFIRNYGMGVSNILGSLHVGGYKISYDLKNPERPAMHVAMGDGYDNTAECFTKVEV